MESVTRTIVSLSKDGEVTFVFEGVLEGEFEGRNELETSFGKLFFEIKSDGVLLASTNEKYLAQKNKALSDEFSFFGDQAQFVVAKVDSSDIIHTFLPFVSKEFNAAWRGVLKAGVKVDGEELYLDGLAQENVGNQAFLASLKRQGRLDFLMDKVISDKTALVTFFSLTDGLRFKDDLLQYFYANEESVPEEWATFNNDYGIQFEELFYAVEGQAGMAQVFVEGRESKLFYLPLLDEERVVGWLDDATNKMEVDSEGADSLYRGVRLGVCPINDFPSVMLGKEFSIGEQTKPSYIVLDGYCVFGDLFSLRQLIIDYEEDEVWGRSIDMKESVQSHVSPCQLGVVCNPHFLSQLMVGHQWSFGVNDFAKKIESQKVIALEYAWDGEECFVDFSISGAYEEWHNEVEKELLVQEKELEFDLDTVVLTKPLLVTNKETKQKEIILFDAANNVMLISQKGKKRWERKLEGTLVGDVEEVDLYKNGKVQYLICTSEKLYCLDRLGRDVKDFPWSLPDDQLITGYSVIDYDRNKNYRILVSTTTGDLYLFDKNHKNLKGWTPAKTSGRFKTTPVHLRVRGKDYIAGQHSDGSVEVRRRSASLVPHFPKTLGEKAMSKMVVEKTSSFESTAFVSVLSNNLAFKINLYGEEIKRKQFPKEEHVSVLELVGGGLSFVSQSESLLTLYDSKFKEKFEIKIDGEVAVQGYQLKSKQYYFVRSVKDGSLLVYDSKGVRIDIEPIFSSSDIALLYFAKTKSYKMFFVEGNKMRIKSLKLD